MIYLLIIGCFLRAPIGHAAITSHCHRSNLLLKCRTRRHLLWPWSWSSPSPGGERPCPVKHGKSRGAPLKKLGKLSSCSRFMETITETITY